MPVPEKTPYAAGHSPPKQPVPPLSEAERKQSLRETLNEAPVPVRIFAYGSLIWNPCFDFVSREPARLDGYRRSFAIWTVHARGTPRSPGLGLALLPGNDVFCDGVLFTLPSPLPAPGLLPLWEREMWTDAYHPEWVLLSVGNGHVPGLTFVVSFDAPQFAGNLSRGEAARYIATASGKFGSCRDYLSETVAALRCEGLSDPALESLLKEVDAVRSRAD